MQHCYFCKGRVEQKSISHFHQWGEKIFLFKNVPAEVCLQCGETYFGPEALDQMDRIVENQPQPIETTQVPVYSL